ncbi:transcription factor mef2A-like isoform X3 [Biomphalaria glabrata]|uniref:Transcription factor mef2A-like isoform X3 n=1 Tax=Biomphalaria glabrata TaxID=6526 RepID=A0A2C9KL92_BIOGL|nr:transcription factor mef2A-like isoform X3 [Biomphalaria glabrata]XP_055869570.1 transcription factor mef2A-like isoform X3 [Biomphalaria glabrata]
MMTQDRATGQPMAQEVNEEFSRTPASTRLLNLNPSAQPFRQTPSGSTPPKNLNPSAPIFQQSGERSPSDVNYLGQEAGSPGLLTNGGIHHYGTNYSLGASSNLSKLQAPHQIPSLMVNGAAQVAPHVAAHPMLTTGGRANHLVPSSKTQYFVAVPDNLNGPVPRQQQQQARITSNHLGLGNGEPGDNVLPNEAVPPVGGGEEETEEEGADAASSEGGRYPESVLEPIKKQMQFYFSSENLPNDKFLNSKMDNDKYIPLELFLDFGRIKPICDNYEQLAQAVELSSILELNESRTKVRVSQCRKTLTLRGFPANATKEEICEFILSIGGPSPTHIEFVMLKEKCSNWYVSFKDESIALNCFFKLHNAKAEYKGYPIGCCIKSSGTLAAAGYFPSSEESNQRRMAQQNHVSVPPVNPTATPAMQSTLAQPQQPQTLMQPYNTMPIYNQLVQATPGIYYQQATPAPYLGWTGMTSMLTPNWAGPAAMEPGLIMQNNGLQPQHIRTNMPRHIMPQTGAQHRFNKPQRNRQQVERSASERSDRGSVVSISSAGQSRSSPRSVDSGSSAGMVQQSGAYVTRRPRDEVVINQQQLVQTAQHQYVTPIVTQQQQHVVTTAAPTTIVNPVESTIHFPQQQPIIVQPTMTVPTTAPPMPTPQTNNPPPLTPQQMHHQPPPQLHHHQQPPHQHQPPAHHPAPHPVSHQQHHQPPPLSHHQSHHQQPLQGGNHQSHPNPHMMPPLHHPQPHHQMPPPSVSHHQHQQPPLGNRQTDRKRGKRNDVRNQRNQSSRVSSQAPVPPDNFTMEANSFPPLPGAANSVANSDVSLENRMSDIVRGKPPRTSVSSSSGVQRAPSTTPSPVATPAPPVVSSAPQRVSGPAAVDVPSGGDDADSLQEDDTSSSFEEGDTDETRSIRSETQSATSSEPSVVPIPSRSQKANTPVMTPTPVSSHRPGENRPGVHNQSSGPTRIAQQPAPPQQVLISPALTSPMTQEAPKPSYAQMVAQKNRDAANGITPSDASSSVSSNPITNSGTLNGPSAAGAQNNSSTASSNLVRSNSQTSNAFREQGNHQAGAQPVPRSAQRGSSKDNVVRAEGPTQSSRPSSNGPRRNSKENRSGNKFDRRKPEPRPK